MHIIIELNLDTFLLLRGFYYLTIGKMQGFIVRNAFWKTGKLDQLSQATYKLMFI